MRKGCEISRKNNFVKKNSAKTKSVVAATINCTQKTSALKVLYLMISNQSSFTLRNVWWKEFFLEIFTLFREIFVFFSEIFAILIFRQFRVCSRNRIKGSFAFYASERNAFKIENFRRNFFSWKNAEFSLVDFHFSLGTLLIGQIVQCTLYRNNIQTMNDQIGVH